MLLALLFGPSALLGFERLPDRFVLQALFLDLAEQNDFGFGLLDERRERKRGSVGIGLLLLLFFTYSVLFSWC